MIQILLVVPIGCDKKGLGVTDLYILGWTIWQKLAKLIKTATNLLRGDFYKVLPLLLVLISTLVTVSTPEQKVSH